MSPRATPGLLCGLLAMAPVAAWPVDVPDVVPPTLPGHAKSVEAFVPVGWAVEARLDGPVDTDALPDVVLLLRDRDPANVIEHDGLGANPLDTNPRLLLVLMAEASGGYRRLAQSDQVIRRNKNPVLSDPLEKGGLSLHRRVLSVGSGVFSSAGSWSMGHTTYRFRWQDGCMRLIGVDEHSVQRNTGEVVETSVNLLTRRTIRSVGSIEHDRTTVHRGRLDLREPLCFADATDGDFPALPEI